MPRALDLGEPELAAFRTLCERARCRERHAAVAREGLERRGLERTEYACESWFALSLHWHAGAAHRHRQWVWLGAQARSHGHAGGGIVRPFAALRTHLEEVFVEAPPHREHCIAVFPLVVVLEFALKRLALVADQIAQRVARELLSHPTRQVTCASSVCIASAPVAQPEARAMRLARVISFQARGRGRPRAHLDGVHR